MTRQRIFPVWKSSARERRCRAGRRPQHWTATIYPGPMNNFVFNASTIFWCQDLSSPPGHMLPWSHWSRPHGPDERVQRITRNLLSRAIDPDNASKVPVSLRGTVCVVP